MSYPLVCLGNPLLDLQLDVTPEYLAKYELDPNGLILAEEKHLPIYGEIINKPGLHVLAGGAAQNTARGAQYILPPNSVVYFGSVGKDDYAQKLIEANAKYGLKAAYQVQENISTGKCAALITGHDRSLVTDLAAANHFTADHLDKPENWSYVKNASHYYIGGYHLTVSPEAIKKLGEHAAAENKVFAMNISAPFIAQFYKAPLDASIPYVDYLIANESEAAAFAEAQGWSVEKTDLVAIAKDLAKLPKANEKRPRTVIFTHNVEPTVTVSYDHATGEYKVQEFPVRELSASKIVDTNGAGDAFAAGFIASLVEGKDLTEAVNVGHWTAALSIQEIGPSLPFPKVQYKA